MICDKVAERALLLQGHNFSMGCSLQEGNLFLDDFPRSTKSKSCRADQSFVITAATLATCKTFPTLKFC